MSSSQICPAFSCLRVQGLIVVFYLTGKLFASLQTISSVRRRGGRWVKAMLVQPTKAVYVAVRELVSSKAFMHRFGVGMSTYPLHETTVPCPPDSFILRPSVIDLYFSRATSHAL